MRKTEKILIGVRAYQKKRIMKTKIEFETFRNMDTYETSILKQENPSCFNGIVRVEKFKVTIEPIEESKEIISERLEKLWAESDNYHDMEPIKKIAKHIGYKIKSQWKSIKKKP